MNLRNLCEAMGYTVLTTKTLPFTTRQPDGTEKRTDYIVSESEKTIWMSPEAFESLKKQTT